MAAKSRTKIIVALILLAAAVVGIMIFGSGESRREMDAYLDRLRAQGEKLTIGEVAPAYSRDAASDAQKFMSLMGLGHSFTNSAPMMKILAPGRAMAAWREESIPVDRSTNVWPSLAAESKSFRSQLIDADALLKIPSLQFDLNYSQGFSLLLPHLAKVKQAEVTMCVCAMLVLHEGKQDEAWTDLQAAVSLVGRYRAEPLIISHLVRASMANLATSLTWEFLNSGKLTASQLAWLQSEWEGMEFFKVTEPAFLMERLTGMDAFQTARKSYDSATKFLNNQGGSGATFYSDPKLAALEYINRYPRYWNWKRRWSYDEEMCLLQRLGAGVNLIRSIEGGAAFVPGYKLELQEQQDISKLHVRAARNYMLEGVLGNEWISNTLLKYGGTEAARRLVIAAIALERYRLRHSKYPESLDALVPEFLEKPPIDFMDGKPLRYRPVEGSDFILYSVGEDGVDNSGDATILGQDKNRLHNWLKGNDIVWPRMATPTEIADYKESELAKINGMKPRPRASSVKQ